MSCKIKCYLYSAPIRQTIIFILFFGVILCYAHRMVLNVAIIEMIAAPSNNFRICPQRNITIPDDKLTGVRQNWTEAEQSYILCAFYAFYFLSHIAAKKLCTICGAKYIVCIGVSSSTLLTGLIPLITIHTHWIFLVILRAIMGIGQGLVFPGFNILLHNWTSSRGKNIRSYAIYSASTLGIVTGAHFSGIIISSTKHWVYTFYFFSTAGVLWIVIFLIWSSNYPSDHAFITNVELEDFKSNVKEEPRKIPINDILKDIKVWALVVGLTGHNFITYTLITYLPKYMFHVHNYNIRENAYGSSLPFWFYYFSTLTFSYLSRYLIGKNIKVTLIRKSFASISTIVCSVVILMITYLGCHHMMVLICVSSALFFKGLVNGGIKANCFDLSTCHGDFILMLSSGIASTSGIVTPLLIGLIVKDNNFEQWQLVFMIIMGICILTNIFYLCVATSTRRRWDYTEEEWKNKEEKQKTKWYLEN